MTHTTTTDNFSDDDFDNAGTDDNWPDELAAEARARNTANDGKAQHKLSALRSIEARRERERLRRELEDLDFDSGTCTELD